MYIEKMSEEQLAIIEEMRKNFNCSEYDRNKAIENLEKKLDELRKGDKI